MLHADSPLPVAQIAHAAGLQYTPAASALQTLQKRGLVSRTRRAGQDEFGPNRTSPHFPMAYATALVDLPIAEAVRGGRALAAYAYGSMATSDGVTPESDLDLLVVGDIRDRAALREALSAVGATLGRAVDAFILSPENLEEARARQDPHVTAALAGVRLFGEV